MGYIFLIGWFLVGFLLSLYQCAETSEEVKGYKKIDVGDIWFSLLVSFLGVGHLIGIIIWWLVKHIDNDDRIIWSEKNKE